MRDYREGGVELIQARGTEGRFEYQGVMLRLGLFNGPEGWYIGVHMASSKPCARLSLEFAETQKEAKDMLQYGFFLRPDETPDLVEHMRQIGMLSVTAGSRSSDALESKV